MLLFLLLYRIDSEMRANNCDCDIIVKNCSFRIVYVILLAAYVIQTSPFFMEFGTRNVSTNKFDI